MKKKKETDNPFAIVNQGVLTGYTGDAASRQEFEQAVASVMMVWILFSRDNLLNDLLATNGQAWDALQFSKYFKTASDYKSYLGMLKKSLNTDLATFLGLPSDTLLSSVALKDVAVNVDKNIVEPYWFSDVPFCPDDPTIMAMLSGAMGFMSLAFKTTSPRKRVNPPKQAKP